MSVFSFRQHAVFHTSPARKIGGIKRVWSWDVPGWYIVEMTTPRAWRLGIRYCMAWCASSYVVIFPLVTE